MGDSEESRREEAADQETYEADSGAKELVIESRYSESPTVVLKRSG